MTKFCLFLLFEDAKADVLSEFVLSLLNAPIGFTIGPLLHLLVHLVLCFGFPAVVLRNDLLQFPFSLDSSQVPVLFGLDEVDDLLPAWLPLQLFQKVFLPDFKGLCSLADTLTRGHVAMGFVLHESIFVAQDFPAPHHAQGKVCSPRCTLSPRLLALG